MTDEEYRHIVRVTTIDQKHYVYAFSRFTHGSVTKHRIWLKLKGLIETADMIND